MTVAARLHAGLRPLSMHATAAFSIVLSLLFLEALRRSATRPLNKPAAPIRLTSPHRHLETGLARRAAPRLRPRRCAGDRQGGA